MAILKISVVDINGQPVTGDAGNLTLYVVTDGVAVAYSGDIDELPHGKYAVSVAESGVFQSVGGISSTSGAIVIDASWQNDVSDGTGAFPITLTVVDDSAVPVSGAKVRFQVAGGFAVQITNSSGQVTFNSDAGSWLCYVGTSASYIPASSYTVVVNASGVVTSGDIEVTAVTLPSSGSTSITLYSDEYDPEGNALVGASDRTAYVVALLPGSKFSPLNKLHYQALSDKGNGSATNASGRWTMELPTGVDIIIKIVDATTGKAEAWKVSIPETVGTYSLWELGPEETTLLL